MDAPPPKLSIEQFNQTIREHIDQHYRKSEGSYFCQKCGAKIQQATGSASIHDGPFQEHCAGFGEVKMFALPYCPNCEGEPKVTATCVHIPQEAGNR